MAIRDILIIPDKRLRLISEPVKAVDAALRTLVEDMFATMYEAPGIGLAAIQIGVAQRVVIMDLAKKDETPEPLVFLNPEIVWSSDDTSTSSKYSGIDHINGVLFIDHISKLKRAMVMKKFTKAAKKGVSPALAKDKEPSHHIG